MNDAVEESSNSLPGNFKVNTKRYNMTEMMFSMEKGGCAVAQANQGESKQNPKGEKTKKRPSSDGDDTKTDGVASTDNCASHDTSKTGLAPWQEGVLERLGQELTPQEYNMYVVHHGRMLVSFGQIQACTPREKDFVYGSLEPIPVQTLRSFKVSPRGWKVDTDNQSVNQTTFSCKALNRIQLHLKVICTIKEKTNILPEQARGGKTL